MILSKIIAFYKKYLADEIRVTENYTEFSFYVETNSNNTNLYIFNQNVNENEKPIFWKHIIDKENIFDDMKSISQSTFVRNFLKSNEFKKFQCQHNFTLDELILYNDWLDESYKNEPSLDLLFKFNEHLQERQ